MKKSRVLLLLLFALLALCLPALAQETVEILYPSKLESNIVDGRDFYVIATVPKDARTGEVRLIDAEGRTVRAISGTDAPQFFLEYEALNAFNTDQAEYFMPDLVYRPEEPDSLWDGSIKCYLKNGFLFAIVPGGYYRMDGRDIVDENGAPYAPLKAGEYTLEVEAGGAAATEGMTLGPIPAKAMARFSPSGHLKSVSSAAVDIGMRTYFDPLPGYWSPASIIPGQEKNPYFAEIKERWQLADSMEYETGTVHFFVYNLSPTCATIAVELGRLQNDRAVDTPRLQAYHYDIGEPLLGYADSITNAYLLGQFTLFEPGDYLALTRAETTDMAQDNVYIAYEGEPRPVDVDVSDGLTVPVGKAMTLFGVVRPIQNAPEDLKQLTESSWEIGNRISEIEYAFVCGDEAWTERKPVGLDRMLAADWKGYSLYEFAHSFVFADALAGKTVVVTAKGYDVHGAAAEGAEETFQIDVVP